MTKKILLGGIAALALSGMAIVPAAAQGYDTYTTHTYYYSRYTDRTLDLDQVSDAADRINNIAVEVPSGAYAGEVRSVRTDFAGDPSRIGISLRSGRFVWVDANDVRFDPQRHVLRSDLTYGQLEDMSI